MVRQSKDIGIISEESPSSIAILDRKFAMIISLPLTSYKLNLNLESKSNSLIILCQVGRILAFTMLVILMWSPQSSKSLFKRCHNRCLLTPNPVIYISVTL